MSERARRPIDIEDLFRVRWLDEPRLSRDGRRLAYSQIGLDRARDAMVSWVCVDGRTHEGASPRWSPDGAWLAYVAPREGRDQVWLWAGGDAPPRSLTAHPDGASRPCWSPDGRRLAFVAGRQLWVMAAEGGLAQPLTDGEREPSLPCWLPNGREVACVVPHPDGIASEVWLCPVDGSAAPRRALSFGGPIRSLTCAPDGRALAFIGHDRGPAQGVNFGLWQMPLDSAPRCLTAEFDRSVGLTVRSDDARGLGPPDLAWIDHAGEARIYFAFAEGGSSHIAWVGLDGRVHPAVTGERACLSFSVADQADALAFVAADAADPGEVRLADRDGGGERAVTSVNAAWLDEVRVIPPRRVDVRADDGQAIEAWLIAPETGAPSAGGPRPLILQIHGGPHYSIGNRFYLEFQRLAALGYAVVYANPRGSQGYGERYATCIRGAWGGRDYADVMSVLEAALAEPGVDPARLAVTGVSYGAYMTHLIIARTHRFRAAITENGISNLVSNFAGTTGQAFWTWQLEGTPETQPERYRALSPLTYASAVRTPLLMIHAEQDTNCPVGQSEELRAALRAQAEPVEAELVRIPGEGHMMNLVGAPSRRLSRAAALDAWLARWLDGPAGRSKE